MRFGSAHFRLARHVLARTTFCHPDSSTEPEAFGTAELAAHPDFRGPEIVAAGCSIAEHGWLDARIIGDAVRAGRHDPQVLKRMWHCTARFGHPPRRGQDGGLDGAVSRLA